MPDKEPTLEVKFERIHPRNKKISVALIGTGMLISFVALTAVGPGWSDSLPEPGNIQVEFKWHVEPILEKYCYAYYRTVIHSNGYTL